MECNAPLRMRHDRLILVVLAILVRVHAREKVHARRTHTSTFRRDVRERELCLPQLQRVPKVEEVVHACKGRSIERSAGTEGN